MKMTRLKFYRGLVPNTKDAPKSQYANDWLHVTHADENFDGEETIAIFDEEDDMYNDSDKPQNYILILTLSELKIMVNFLENNH